MTPSRTWRSANGSIIPCSRDIFVIQRSDLIDMGAQCNGANLTYATPPIASIQHLVNFFTSAMQPYIQFLMLLGMAIIAGTTMIVASHFLGPRRLIDVKERPYESGMPRQAFSPRQADVLICAGRLPFKLAPVIRRIYDQMPQPKWVISMGACASPGGIFDNYAMVQGIDTIVPVDVYVPGCPPRPEGLLYGVLLLHKKIKGESLFDRVPRRTEQPLDERGLRLPPEQIDEISEPFGNSVHQFRSA